MTYVDTRADDYPVRVLILSIVEVRPDSWAGTGGWCPTERFQSMVKDQQREKSKEKDRVGR